MRSASLKLFLAYIFIGFYSLVSAQNIPPKPDILYPVYDKVGLLTQQEKDALNNKLIKFADSSSTEIEVIILPNTGGEDVNYLAARYGEKWGIGQKELIMVSFFLLQQKTAPCPYSKDALWNNTLQHLQPNKYWITLSHLLSNKDNGIMV